MDSMDYPTSRPLSGFLPTAREVLLSPRRFFASIDRGGRLRAPLVFAVACAAVSLVLSGAYDVALAAATGRLGELGLAGYSGPGPALAILGVLLVLSPLIALLGLYVGAAVQHLFVWAILRGHNRGFERTLRMVAYASSALALVSWVPVLGVLVGAYGVYVYAVGLGELHEGAGFGRALAAALAPYLLGLALLASNVYFGDLTLAGMLRLELEGGGPLQTTGPPPGG